MKAIPPATLRMVEENAPEFLRAVEVATKAQTRVGAPAVVRLAFDTFVDDPLLLYAGLWYAATRGVTCTIVPPV